MEANNRILSVIRHFGGVCLNGRVPLSINLLLTTVHARVVEVRVLVVHVGLAGLVCGHVGRSVH